MEEQLESRWTKTTAMMVLHHRQTKERMAAKRTWPPHQPTLQLGTAVQLGGRTGHKLWINFSR